MLKIDIDKNNRLVIDDVVLYVAIACTALMVLVADVFTELGVAVWVFYIIPLKLSLYSRKKFLPTTIASIVTLLMVITFFTDPPGGNRDIAQLNRIFGLLTFWVMAFVGYFFIRNKLAVAHQRWLQTAQVGLNEVMQGEKTVQQLGQQILTYLCEYLDASAAAIYVHDKQIYQRAATYGVSANGTKETFTLSDGLLGQAASDKRGFVLVDVPDDYLNIATAFGETKPRHLLIAPSVVDGQSYAVVEMGFLNSLPENGLTLLNHLSDSIAQAFRSAQYRAEMKNLLEETQRQSEQLQAQSEELRVSNEELEEQSRALQESQSRLEQQQAEMEQTNAQLEEQTQLLESQRDDLERAQGDLKLRSRELEQASQYKSDFLANMSHELRTPLNSSLILAKLLADNEEGNLTDEQVRYAGTIQSAGNDLLILINDILDLSKIEAGHMEIVPEDRTMRSLVRDISGIFEPLTETKDIEFIVDVKKSAPTSFHNDAKRLEQILKNLLSNAVKFTEKGSVTLVIREHEKGMMAFDVIDTGIGISPDKHSAVFDAFRQADGTTNRKYGGTGLGLSISRELARLLGGEIRLQSEEGKGSTFTLIVPETYQANKVQARDAIRNPIPTAPPLTLPRPDAKMQKNVAPNLPDDRDELTNSKRTMLIVEDDVSFAKILADLAHEQQFQCLIATTADEGLKLASEYLPNAVLLDVGLPDHSGLSVLDRLKQDPRTRHIPVHIISAEDYTDTAFSLGAMGYMLKPVKREELVGILKKMENRFNQQVSRVLVVEDNDVQRESMTKLLDSKDVEITAVGTAAECLKHLKQETFDCMVMDLNLPDSSGYTLLQTLSEEQAYSFPPVIVYTGHDLSRDEEQQLRRYSKSIIIKGAKSPERLLDEVSLFLHQVVSDMPPEHQRLLKKARSRDAMLEGRRILVVEDDVRNVYAMTSIFEPRGAIVQIARNGKEGLEALKKSLSDPAKKIDLVLMDVMMPEMDGITATREIRKLSEFAKLPVIMLTAKAMKDDQERCLDAGANDYMAKPLDVEKLLSLVRVWIPR